MTTARRSARRTLAGLVLAISAALAFTMTAAVTTSASAAPAPESTVAAKAPRAYYGAIAMANDGAWGVAYDYRTRAGAYDRALKGCRKNAAYPGTCRKIGWVRNACGAVAAKFNSRGFVTRYKYGFAATKVGAKRKARANFGGRIVTWVCTTR
ncbi:hypothetical protein GCM10023340_40690 [Nocardioides marinquilinus]|uniref:DUF4189 domain-containing protein n=1 Tax=Nocardioides marinquilinus TaxID=1210400 RepID=A0ABP9Q1V1_9ACTN